MTLTQLFSLAFRKISTCSLYISLLESPISLWRFPFSLSALKYSTVNNTITNKQKEKEMGLRNFFSCFQTFADTLLFQYSLLINWELIISVNRDLELFLIKKKLKQRKKNCKIISGAAYAGNKWVLFFASTV